MTRSPPRPDPVAHDALERLFHEPHRLAVLSALCAADKGLTFTELKTVCDLTDGNLNRHLKALADAGVVAIHKAFVDLKPRTTVTLTARGLARFQDYVDALERTLHRAQRALADPKPRAAALWSVRPQRA